MRVKTASQRRTVERKNEAQKAKKKSKDDSRGREGKEGKGVGGRGPVTSHDM